MEKKMLVYRFSYKGGGALVKRAGEMMVPFPSCPECGRGIQAMRQPKNNTKRRAGRMSR